MKYILAVQEEDGTIKFYYNRDKYETRLIEVDLELCKEELPDPVLVKNGIMGSVLYFDEQISDWCILLVNTSQKIPYRYHIMNSTMDTMLCIMKDENKKKVGMDKIINYGRNRLNSISLLYNFDIISFIK